MIFIRMWGGLGNQLFQYAFIRSYSLEHNLEFRMRAKYFWKKFFQEVLLYRWTKNHQALGYHNGLQVTAFKLSYKYSFLEDLFNLKKKKKCLGVAEEDLGKIADLPKDNLEFFGYFNDLKYFEKHRKILLEDLVLRRKSSGCERWEQIIKSENNSVSLHVRRGDYVINPVVRSSAITLSEESDYYQKALAFLVEKLGKISIFIFSDDIAWVKSNMPLGEFSDSIHYVEYKNQKKNSHEDMFLMSCCNHNITANSTFSWWGAWLNQNPAKIVIIPKYWMKKQVPEPVSEKIISDKFVALDYNFLS